MGYALSYVCFILLLKCWYKILPILKTYVKWNIGCLISKEVLLMILFMRRVKEIVK